MHQCSFLIHFWKLSNSTTISNPMWQKNSRERYPYVCCFSQPRCFLATQPPPKLTGWQYKFWVAFFKQAQNTFGSILASLCHLISASDARDRSLSWHSDPPGGLAGSGAMQPHLQLTDNCTNFELPFLQTQKPPPPQCHSHHFWKLALCSCQVDTAWVSENSTNVGLSRLLTKMLSWIYPKWWLSARWKCDLFCVTLLFFVVGFQLLSLCHLKWFCWSSELNALRRSE